jgi:bifunctional non-homologous end joining protein LigD
VLFPEQGVTKRALAEYYRAVAPWILPMLRGRPLTLVRCPRGREKECFVQRRAGDAVPDAVRRVAIPDEDEAGGTATHLAVESLPGLLSLVQIGVLELHTWGARRDRLDRPDRMVIDLDPDPSLPYQAVTDAAFRVREMLESAGLGAAKKEREGRIYVDYLRNGWGATSITPYSTRARPGAPVATPVRWEELRAGVNPASFNVTTVPERLAEMRDDPWEDYSRSGRALSRAVRESLGAR